MHHSPGFARQGGVTKLFVTIAVICWLISGLAGSWMLEGNDMHLKTIAGGPISLVKGFNDTPPQYPGQ
jgi:hypothetical protein